MATISFDEHLECNDEFVSLRLVDRRDETKVGGILLLEKTFANNKMSQYRVEALGKKAADEYGLTVGDYVLADRLSVFYDSAPICVMKYTNVIVKTNESMTEYYPLRNMVFVTPDTREAETNVDGIIVSNFKDNLKLGTVIATAIDSDKDFKVAVGDRVMLTKGNDKIRNPNGDGNILVYKAENIIAKVVE